MGIRWRVLDTPQMSYMLYYAPVQHDTVMSTRCGIDFFGQLVANLSASSSKDAKLEANIPGLTKGMSYVANVMACVAPCMLPLKTPILYKPLQLHVPGDVEGITKDEVAASDIAAIVLGVILGMVLLTLGFILLKRRRQLAKAAEIDHQNIGQELSSTRPLVSSPLVTSPAITKTRDEQGSSLEPLYAPPREGGPVGSSMESPREERSGLLVTHTKDSKGMDSDDSDEGLGT